jgi:cysteine desulfurase/selenocysteine lyase
MLEPRHIRKHFPILEQTVNGYPLVYLDNAATTQKPRQVLRAIQHFYTRINANIHRGVHTLSDASSQAYEDARATVQHFINARRSEEIIFTSGTTASINLVADSFGRQFIRPKDEIIITEMEHHSNIVPWQMLCRQKQARLKVLPFDDNGCLRVDQLADLITPRTRLIAVTYVSNVLGVINPVRKIIEKAHARNIPVLIDAAQAIQHIPIDVEDLDCDFLAFSGHKIYAGTGIGILYGKEKWLESMPPYQVGGGMIRHVRFEKTEFESLPLKFEAGTPNVAGAVSLASAINFLLSIGQINIAAHEQALIKTATQKLCSFEHIRVYAPEAKRMGVVSFNVKGVSDYDAGVILDKMGIAVRTGTHCGEPIMRHYGVSGMIRASFALYNTFEEVGRLIHALHKASLMLTT